MSWEQRTLPGGTVGLPSTGAKHLRFAHCPADGRIWECGGDYTKGPQNDSSRNELWSYGIRDNSWRLEQPYCLSAGSIQPQGPDEVGWCWDTRRNRFWMVPGYMGSGADLCAGQATLIRNHLMSLDFISKRWTDHGTAMDVLHLGDTPKFFHYDSVRDELVGFGPGPSVLTYVIEANQWSIVRLSVGGNPLEELSAVDWATRRLYGLDATLARIYEYDLDARRLVRTFSLNTMAPLDSRIGITPFVWAPAIQALLAFEHAGTRQLHIWQGGQWRVELVPIINGVKVKGNCGVWDPLLNVFLITGGFPPTFVYLWRPDGRGAVTVPIIQGIDARVGP